MKKKQKGVYCLCVETFIHDNYDLKNEDENLDIPSEIKYFCN